MRERGDESVEMREHGDESGREREETTMSKKRTGTIGGYFTVEASLVLPIVIASIVFIVYVLLYWYNRCLMDQDTAMLAMQAVIREQGTLEETGREVKAWKEQNMTEKYVGWQMGELVLTQGRGRIKASREGKLVTDHSLWQAYSSYENRILHPAAFLRLCRRWG